jgi:hypothetical protein
VFSNMANIDKGMDVFDINGEKIGTVDEVYSSLYGSSANQPASPGSGGGAGALGDESRVNQSPGHGGQGALGNESRAGTTPPGGSGALGNESMVTGNTEATQTNDGTPAGINSVGESGVDEILVEEEVDIPVSAEMAGGATDERYFKVQQGGILGIGGKSLYIPFSAVQDVVAGDSVTLDCTKDECDARYGSMPASLQQ